MPWAPLLCKKPDIRDITGLQHSQGQRLRWDLEIPSYIRHFIAPKASAEGACIWKEVGYYGACMMGYCGACMMGYCGACMMVYYGVWRMGYFGIWVIRASGNFIRVWDVFWRLLVTVENYDVSTKLITIFIIELGIWVILASGNFIRVRDVFFGGCWLQKKMMFQQNWL